MSEWGISIDPSISQIAFALWLDGALVYSDLLLNSLARGSVHQRSIRMAQDLALELDPWVDCYAWLAIEDQIIRPRGPARSLIVLKQAAATVSATLSNRYRVLQVYDYLPETWKGGNSKLGTEHHLMGVPEVGRPGVLSASEKCAVTLPACLKHYRSRAHLEQKAASDVFDAIGIGLYHLRRY